MTGDVYLEGIQVAEDPLVMLSQLRAAISGLQFGEFGEFGESGSRAAVPCLQKLALSV